MPRTLTQIIILQIAFQLQGIMALERDVGKATSSKIRGLEPG